ncbi:MAG: helix-turn-helix transcriptional regulator [Roseburia sp.]|nr:helix-turn-helix transcriptional regulator [Roseburia sp.]
MISSDVMRGYNELMILYLLLEQDSYGYEISRRIREISSEKYVMKETTLYSAFTRLEKSGYMESYFGTETNGKQRTYYKITQAGIDYYHEKCEEWKLVKEVVEKFIAII